MQHIFFSAGVGEVSGTFLGYFWVGAGTCLGGVRKSFRTSLKGTRLARTDENLCELRKKHRELYGFLGIYKSIYELYTCYT